MVIGNLPPAARAKTFRFKDRILIYTSCFLNSLASTLLEYHISKGCQAKRKK